MFIIVYHCLSIPVVSCFDEPKNSPRYSKMGSPRWPYRRSEALWWLGCAFHAMPAESASVDQGQSHGQPKQQKVSDSDDVLCW